MRQALRRTDGRSTVAGCTRRRLPQFAMNRFENACPENDPDENELSRLEVKQEISNTSNGGYYAKFHH
jgi:hypothetical protein